jgi:hemolysin III
MLHATLADGGPLYRETDLHSWIAEPFNALTALPFLFLAIYWRRKLLKLRPEPSVLLFCLAMLAVGGVGGTLFHAFRASRFFYLLDILPIALIGLTLSGYLWHVVTRLSWAPVPVAFLGIAAQRDTLSSLPRQIAITASYGILAILIVTPLAILLWRRRFADGKLLLGSVVLFGAAIGFRALDIQPIAWLPMGTHWLWHVFSCLSITLLIAYIVRSTTFTLTLTESQHGRFKTAAMMRSSWSSPVSRRSSP